MILKDGGECVTDFSLKFFRKNRDKLGRIVKIEIQKRTDEKGEWNQHPFRIVDHKGNQLWLSGCQSGYGGEGPYGAHQVLQELGVNVDFEEIKKKESIVIDVLARG